MIWTQKQIQLKPKTRGFHLVTTEILEQLELLNIRVGMLHIFLQHSSASLTLNENASPEVRRDFERFFLNLSPDDTPYFEHTYEGPDDMPAHIKASLLGNSLNVPIQNGQLALGIWQGIYLGEHRESATARKIMLTLYGQA